MKPAVAPMVKPAHIEDIRMLEGEPATRGLLVVKELPDGSTGAQLRIAVSHDLV